MQDKFIRTGVLLGIGLNVLILICLYILEYRVDLLENRHEEQKQHRD